MHQASILDSNSFCKMCSSEIFTALKTMQEEGEGQADLRNSSWDDVDTARQASNQEASTSGSGPEYWQASLAFPITVHMC